MTQATLAGPDWEDDGPPRRKRADSFASRVVAAAARPARPWLHVSASPRVARFLIEAGARRGKVLLGDVDLRSEEPSNACMRSADALAEDTPSADALAEDMPNADLRGADLRGADLNHVGLSGMDLSAAILLGADLSAADLRRVNLRAADLRDADLRYADLSGAYLSDANFANADLSDASLSGANLSGAFLDEANLADAKLVGVLWSDTTRWPKNVMMAMKKHSVEVRPGVWQVAGSGGAVEVGTSLVPV
jgi:hypothetical protein